MAGLIPQSFIDDLLNRADIVEVVDKRVPLKKTGKNYQACCPFHQEKTPSFSIQPEKQFYYCFGCGAGGNAIGFVMNFEQLDFPLAVEALARDMGIEVPREESAAATKKQSENIKVLDMLERASRFYQQQLRQHENKQTAIDYLKARGVSGEIARDFQLGYAPPGWDNLLKSITDESSNTPLDQRNLFKAGMVIEKEQKGSNAAKGSEEQTAHYYDRFRHRIMFPIRDSRGRTIAFGGRVLGDDNPKYLNSPETPVFHKGAELYGLHECKKAGGKIKRMLVVEGYMDVIALAQMGIRNAVATLGTATSNLHLTRLFRLVPEIVFSFDGDKAGRTAAWRALETSLPLLEDGRQVKFLFLPEGEDPDSLVREIGEEKFNRRVEDATSLADFFFDKLSLDLDIQSIEGKASLSKLAKPLIARFPKGIYGQLMLNRLADIIGVKSESLQQLIEDTPPPVTEASGPPPQDPNFPPYGAQYGHENSYQRKSKAPSKSPSSGYLTKYQKPASLKAINLLLINPEAALSIKQDLSLLRSAKDEGNKLLCSLIAMVQADPETKIATMLGYCYGSSLGGQFTQLLNSEKITPIEGIEQEFNQIVDSILSNERHELRKIEFREKLNATLGPTKEEN